jgi:acetyl esterase/lipase
MSRRTSERMAAPVGDLSKTFAREIAPDASVEGVRFLFDRLAEMLNRKLPEVGALHEGVEIPAAGRTVRVDVVVPLGSGPFPVLVYFHGGAWVAGNPASHRKLAHRFAEGGCLVVSADYRLAPENPFPAAFEDCVVAVEWAAAHAHRFGGDPARIALGGDSAGGNLAAAVAIALAQRRRAPKITAAVLIYGVFDFADVGGPMFARSMRDAYLGRDASAELLKDLRVSPIHGARWLPPSMIVAGGQDPLIDDARALQVSLTAAGVRHEMVVVPGMPHGFVQMEFLGDARRTIERMQAFLARELALSSRSEIRRRWLRLGAMLRAMFGATPRAGRRPRHADAPVR